MEKLKIRSLCLNYGYCEGERAASLFVYWKGQKPFDDPRTAIYSFIEQCKAQCTDKPRELDACCLDTLKVNEKASYCMKCGETVSYFPSKKLEVDLSDYFRRLLEMDIDSFGDAAYPCEEYGGYDDGDCRIGSWSFFQGFPAGFDIVVVNYIDLCFSDVGTMDAEFYTVHGGKVATRPASKGKIVSEH